MAGWIEAQAGPPAAELTEVPDDATTWAAWTREDVPEGITIYELEGAFYVVHIVSGIVAVHAEDVDKETALSTGEALREGDLSVTLPHDTASRLLSVLRHVQTSHQSTLLPPDEDAIDELETALREGE